MKSELNDNARSFSSQEEKLHFALEAAGMGTWEWDIRADRIKWSPSLELMHGLQPGSFAGTFQAFLHDVHPEDRAAVQGQMQRTLEGLEDHHIEYRLQLHDGTVRWVEGRGRVTYDEQGAPIGMIGVCSDITARKESHAIEAFLVEASEALGGTLDYETIITKLAKIAVPTFADWCSVDIEGDNGQIKRLAVNHKSAAQIAVAERYHQTYGVPQQQNWGVLSVIRTGKAELYETIPDALLTAAAEDEGQLATLRGLGLHSAMIVPLKSHHKTFGAITFVTAESRRVYNHKQLASAIDFARRAALAIDNAKLYREAQRAIESYEHELQERQRIEKELRLAKDMADAANLAKTNFLANMSHEIRTPLGVILGYAEMLLLPGHSPQEQADGLDAIKRSSHLLTTIIDDILDLSRVEAGQLHTERRRVHLLAFLQEVRQALSGVASKRGIELIFSLDKEEGPLPTEIETDPLRLKQIFINIVGNAIKFTSRGSVEVIPRWEEKPAAGAAHMQFLVKDSGCGIAADHVDKLFKAFSQADSSTTRRYGGTGLGLALSRRLANLLGGDVVLVESRLQQGSVFAITIDPGNAKFPTSSPGSRQIHASEGAASLTQALHAIKILLVEDHPDNRNLISKMLRHAGAKIEFACNGKEGVEQALQNPFDVVLMDLQMPVMDGYAAMHELRQHGYQKPVVALTAHAMTEERKYCLQLGFAEHVSKPIDRHSLVAKIQTLIGST